MLYSLLRNWCLGVEALVVWVGRLTSLAVPLLAFVVAFEVVARYIFNHPTIWAYDVSLFIFGYIGALCGAFAQQRKAHINVDILYLSVSQRWKNLFNLLSYLLGGFFLVIIFQLAFGKAEEAIEFDYRRQSEWAPSMIHFWIMIDVASALFLLQLSADFLQNLWQLFTGKPLLDKYALDDAADAASEGGKGA
ncbi:TRAP transporter small permease [Pokkaliibacter sp. MBI-7]|uniref:TRAP transporter small permease subunit n=1 Tax=Pokkaliibacter sp. MBI-7 TaxID=3040600 RepID=UPI00244AF306|nr:TRAP transporter small permease [Pokkaliibacter sp. MBI-7]MDH2432448.1 TRAP transporter small permease [Pokkaliibacter sp. MBI-7]